MHEAVAAVRIHIAQEKNGQPYSRDDKPEIHAILEKCRRYPPQYEVTHDSATDGGRRSQNKNAKYIHAPQYGNQRPRQGKGHGPQNIEKLPPE